MPLPISPRDPTAPLRTQRTLAIVAGQSRPPNQFWASPASGNGVPSFRAIVAADVTGLLTLPVTTKGDLLGYDTAPDRVPVGSNGRALFADSTLALGLGWEGGTRTLNSNIVPAANVGTGLTTLMAYTLPAGLINQNQGDSVEVEAMFSFVSGGGIEQMNVVFGSTLLSTITPSGGGGNMSIQMRVINVTQTSQVAMITVVSNVGVVFATYFNCHEDLGTALNISFTALSSAGSGKITQNAMHVKVCTV